MTVGTQDISMERARVHPGIRGLGPRSTASPHPSQDSLVGVFDVVQLRLFHVQCAVEPWKRCGVRVLMRAERLGQGDGVRGSFLNGRPPPPRRRAL